MADLRGRSLTNKLPLKTMNITSVEYNRGRVDLQKFSYLLGKAAKDNGLNIRKR